MSTKKIPGMEERELLTDNGVYHGYVCPYCYSIHESENLAVKCKDSHDELIPEFLFEMGSRMPVEVYVKRHVGDKLISIATYTRKDIREISEEEF